MKVSRVVNTVVVAGVVLAALGGAVLVLHSAYTRAPEDLQSLAPRAPGLRVGAPHAGGYPMDASQGSHEGHATR
jgi:hypothetical protein